MTVTVTSRAGRYTIEHGDERQEDLAALRAYSVLIDAGVAPPEARAALTDAASNGRVSAVTAATVKNDIDR